jgi:hypothetical protein
MVNGKGSKGGVVMNSEMVFGEQDNVSQDRRRLGRNWTRVLPELKSKALTVESTC